MDYVIETIDVTKTFGSRNALDHVSINVRHGSVFGFLGPNGAGKTTEVRIANGVLRPTTT
jgi:ABC-2 type transport system ATP-binding protein